MTWHDILTTSTTIIGLASLLISAYMLVATPDRRLDYLIYHTGARIIMITDGSQLYDLDAQRRVQETIDSGRPYVLPYNHPPFELLWHLPLATMTYNKAYATWSAINVTLWIGAFLFIAPLRLATLPMFVIVFLGFFPAVSALALGQDSILLTFLVVTAIYAARTQRYSLAGVLLALATFKPQLILAVVVGLALEGRGKFLRLFFLTCLILVVISLAMVGLDGLMEYWQLLIFMDVNNYMIEPANMVNLRGLFYLLGLPEVFAPLVSLGIIAALLLYWRRWDDFDGKISLAVCVSVLTSYHLYWYDLTLVIVAVTLSLKHENWLSVLPLLPLLFPFSYIVSAYYGGVSWLAVLIILAGFGIAVNLYKTHGSQSPQPASRDWPMRVID